LAESEDDAIRLHAGYPLFLRTGAQTAGLCEQVVASLLCTITQADGRIRHWGRITLPGEEKARILRVVTLADGVTLHKAFIDCDFREDSL